MPASKTRNRTHVPLHLCHEKNINAGDVGRIGCVYSNWGILSLREDLIPYFEATKEWYAKRT